MSQLASVTNQASDLAQLADTEESPERDDPPTLVIRARSGWAAIDARELWRFRELLSVLAVRDLKLRYKQTVLGVAWVVLQPLMAAAVFAFVFGRVAGLGSDGKPYFLFAYTGLLGWNLFAGVLTRCGACLTGNAQLVSKVFFPRLILPLSTVPGALVDFAAGVAVLAALMAYHGVAPGWHLLAAVAPLTVLVATAVGMGVLVAALAVSYRDVLHMLPVLTQVLLFASPVAYAVSSVPPEVRAAYHVTPLAPALEGFRAAVLGTPPPPWGASAWSAAAAVALLTAGLCTFKRMERRFADVI